MSLQVLLIDDDETVLFLQKRIVLKSSLSSNPTTFKDGKAAIDYLDRHYRTGDTYLILLDINMPVMSGWEFLDSIQSMPYLKQFFVVITTSSIASKDRDMASHYSQVIDYVEKPLTTEICTRLKHLPQMADLL